MARRKIKRSSETPIPRSKKEELFSLEEFLGIYSSADTVKCRTMGITFYLFALVHQATSPNTPTLNLGEHNDWTMEHK